jgi:hypothetical protein
MHTQTYASFEDGESIWRVDFDEDGVQPQYVIASSKRDVHVALKRMYRAPRYDFDWEEYEATDTESTDVVGAVRGPEPPFSVLESRRFSIREHEKRVNQAGFKGVYMKTWRR